MIRTNFWGSLWFVRHAVGAMNGVGHVMMCSSCLSKIGMPLHATYSATKAMQDHFCRGLRHELGSQTATAGIHVSSVHPIGTSTEFFEQAARRSGGARLMSTTPDLFTQPPERVAQAVLRGLYSPRGEIWTSFPTRMGLAIATAFPGVADWLISRAMRKRLHGDV
jgi:short-subunit dehydrogenase